MFDSKSGYVPKFKTKQIDIEKEEYSNNKWRLVLPYLLTISIFFVLFYFLVQLQIIEGPKNVALSGGNNESEIITAPRGVIYDSNNKPLLINIPTFRIMLDNSSLIAGYAPGKEEEIEKKEVEFISKVSSLLNFNEEEIREKYLAQTRSPDGAIYKNKAVMLFKNIEKDDILSIYPNLEKLEGLYLQIDERRQYLYPEELVHILGYAGDVTKEDLERDDSLKYSDVIGKGGIELIYDKYLRGIDGIAEQYIENSENNEYKENQVKRGSDVELYIDVEVQKKLYELLKLQIEKTKSFSGAVAIQDIETGGIIGAVSFPSYDPNALSKNIDTYLKDERNVFLNRLVNPYPPGSTFKVFTASVLLQEGVIDEKSSFKDGGTMDLGGGFIFQNFNKRTLGNIKVRDALAVSSNLFFCNYSLNQSSTIFEKYRLEFNLGEKTGIDISSESKGQLGTAEIKKAIANEAWYLGDNCNLAIGQGYTVITPVQMLSIATALANNGEYIKPRIAKSIVDNTTGEKLEFGRTVDHQLSLDEKNMQIIKEGMHQAVLSGANGVPGTASGLRGVGDAAAKTGTAEGTVKVDGKWQRDTLGWQMGFFPYENPKYAFVAFAEGGKVGGSYLSPMMREFINWFIEYEQVNTQ